VCYFKKFDIVYARNTVIALSALMLKLLPVLWNLTPTGEHTSKQTNISLQLASEDINGSSGTFILGAVVLGGGIELEQLQASCYQLYHQSVREIKNKNTRK